jgi:hypothetical protein
LLERGCTSGYPAADNLQTTCYNVAIINGSLMMMHCQI